MRAAAFDYLGALAGLGWRDAEQLGKDPDLAPLHDDPRWAKLLAGMRGE